MISAPNYGMTQISIGSAVGPISENYPACIAMVIFEPGRMADTQVQLYLDRVAYEALLVELENAMVKAESMRLARMAELDAEITPGPMPMPNPVKDDEN